MKFDHHVRIVIGLEILAAVDRVGIARGCRIALAQ